MARKKSKKTENFAKRHPALTAAILIILVVIIAAAIIFWAVRPDIVHKLTGIGKHTWGEWQVTEEATCGAAGSKTRSCTACDEKETETIPATGEHRLNEDGECTVCGYGAQGTIEGVANSELSIHFLELGNKYTGDCTLIKYGDTEKIGRASCRERV